MTIEHPTSRRDVYRLRDLKFHVLNFPYATDVLSSSRQLLAGCKLQSSPARGAPRDVQPDGARRKGRLALPTSNITSQELLEITAPKWSKEYVQKYMRWFNIFDAKTHVHVNTALSLPLFTYT